MEIQELLWVFNWLFIGYQAGVCQMCDQTGFENGIVDLCL